MSNHIVKICNNGKKDCYFYKNGLLHRENGPAIVLGYLSDNLHKLEDLHLYQQKNIQEGFPSNYQIRYLLESLEGDVVNAIYYLNGEPYTKQEFMDAKVILDLKNELSSELITNQSPIKKSKV